MPGEEVYFATAADLRWLRTLHARLTTLLQPTRGKEAPAPVVLDPANNWVKLFSTTETSSRYPGQWSWFKSSDSSFHDQSTSVAFTGNTDTTSFAITNCSSTANLVAGFPISGSGIPTGALITSIDSSTQITISAKPTATATGVSLTQTQGVWVVVPNGETLSTGVYYRAVACDDVNGVPVYEVIRGASTTSGGTTFSGAKYSYTTAQAVADSAFGSTTLTLSASPTLIWDTDSYFSSSHPTRLTAPSTGKYLVLTNISWALPAADVPSKIQILVNGSGVTGLFGGGGLLQASNHDSLIAGPGYIVEEMVALNAGDYVEILAHQNSGGSLNVTAWNYSLTKIG